MNIINKPAEELEFDIVIVGGGLAGLCAAIAGARQGSKVVLVQDRPVVGGNCSSEIRVVPHGACHSNVWAQETGLPHAILLEDRATNHEEFFDHGMINSRFDLTLLEWARREPNLTLFLNTTVRAVESIPLGPTGREHPALNELGRIDGGPRRILGVYGSQMGSERELLFRAKHYIDATGDGTVGFFAGADYRYGREGRAEFNENLAPVVGDDTTMGSTITMRARDLGRPVPYNPPPWIQIYKSLEEIGYNRTIYHIEKPVYGGYWWLEICNPYHQITDNQAIREELHRHVLGVWNFIKNHSEFKKTAATYVLDWIGMVPGKRESRRLVGDVLLTENDCHTDRNWPDAVAYAGWWIDLHIKGGLLNKDDPGERENVDLDYKHWIRIPVFTVPLRSFYSRNVENLWMAGRTMSVTHVALGPVRVMQTLGMMGHAVGIAAAQAVQNGLTPRQIADPKGPYIGSLRQCMLRNDVRIPGLRNEDSGDFARRATVKASSEAVLDLAKANEARWFRIGPKRLETPLASSALGIVVPITHDRIDALEMFLRNDEGANVTVFVEIQKLKRIWDRPDEPSLATTSFELPAGNCGWFGFPVNAKVEPGHPYRISLRGGGAIAWAASEHHPPGVLLQYLHICSGGPEEKNSQMRGFQPEEIDIPPYRHWRQLTAALAIRISPEPAPFGGENVNNGWAWPESMPNLWISDPLRPMPQHVDLQLEASTEFSCVEVSFDTNLARTTQSAPPFFLAPECARDWRLLTQTEQGEWEEIYAETGNYQRKRRVRFEPVKSTNLRLEVLATNGSLSARVYEVRVYNE